MKIRKMTALQVLEHPDWPELAREYGRENAHPEIGKGVFDPGFYLSLDITGQLAISAAFDGARLVGIVAVIFIFHPQYRKLIADLNGLWLHPSFRTGGAGLRLINEARRLARKGGACGLQVTAPEGSRLERLYTRIAKPLDRVFWLSVKE